MKMRSPFIKLLAIGCISLLGQSCALGTEVGNGVKPIKGGDDNTKTNMNRAGDSGLDSGDDGLTGIFSSMESAEDKQISTFSDHGTAAGSVGSGVSGTILDQEKGSGGVATFSDTRAVVPIAESRIINKATLDPTIIDLTLTGCQSPLFKQNPAGSASFAVVNSATSQKASITISTAAEANTWSISSDDKSLARFVKWSPQVVVTKPGPDGAMVAVPSYGRCTPVVVSAPAGLAGYAEKFTKTTYLVATSRGNTYLTWYVMDGAGDYISRLKRIELDKSPSNPNPAVVISAP